MSLSHHHPAVLHPVHYQRLVFLSVFSRYYDFPPMFHAEMFDPDHWASVFSKAGAKCTVHSVHSVTVKSSQVKLV